MLARRPEEISVGEIVETLEGKLSVVDCVLEPELCYRAVDCPTRDIWVGMTDMIKKQLFSLNLGNIIEKGTPVDDMLQISD